MKISLTGTLALAMGVALWLPAGSALARREASTAGATHVTVTRWEADVDRNGTSVPSSAPPGGTIRKCASNKLIELKAYYTASGPTGGPVQQIWKLNGRIRDKFNNSHMPASGYFFLNNAQGLPSGTWTLRVIYGGQRAGHSSVTIKSKRRC